MHEKERPMTSGIAAPAALEPDRAAMAHTDRESLWRRIPVIPAALAAAFLFLGAQFAVTIPYLASAAGWPATRLAILAALAVAPSAVAAVCAAAARRVSAHRRTPAAHHIRYVAQAGHTLLIAGLIIQGMAAAAHGAGAAEVFAGAMVGGVGMAVAIALAMLHPTRFPHAAQSVQSVQSVQSDQYGGPVGDTPFMRVVAAIAGTAVGAGVLTGVMALGTWAATPYQALLATYWLAASLITCALPAAADATPQM